MKHTAATAAALVSPGIRGCRGMEKQFCEGTVGSRDECVCGDGP